MKTLIKPNKTILLFTGLFFTDCQHMDLHNHTSKVPEKLKGQQKDYLNVHYRPKTKKTTKSPLNKRSILSNHKNSSSKRHPLTIQPVNSNNKLSLNTPTHEQQTSNLTPLLFDHSLFNSFSLKTLDENHTPVLISICKNNKPIEDSQQPQNRRLYPLKLEDYQSNSIGNYKKYRRSISMESYLETLGGNTPESINSFSQPYQNYLNSPLSNTSIEITNSTTTLASNSSCITPLLDPTQHHNMNDFTFPDIDTDFLTPISSTRIKTNKLKKKSRAKKKAKKTTPRSNE